MISPFALMGIWLHMVEDTFNAIVEPMADAYWAWEWERTKREMRL